MNRGLGYIPDQRDDGRDKLLSSALPPLAERRRPSVHVYDLLPAVPRRLNQGPIGSCVPNAGFLALCTRAEALGHVLPLGARLWGYYLARDAAGVAKFDLGCRIRDFFRCLNHFGFLAEADYKYGYDVKKWRKKPPPLSYRRAIDQKLAAAPGRGQMVSYYRIWGEGSDRVELICEALARNMPVVFGTNVSRSFVVNEEAGIEPVKPPVNQSIAGGHAMMIAGWDPARQAFRVISSWGPEWGEDGTCWLHRDYITWGSSQDFWAVDQVPIYRENV